MAISANEVTLSNLDAFEAQMIRDLPIGTPKASVQDYITRTGLKCSFVEPRGPDWGNLFGCRIENIGHLGIFSAGLGVGIYLDAKAQVKNLFFRVDYE